MATCYFDSDLKKSYRCEYNIKDNSVNVTIDYDIHDELKKEKIIISNNMDIKNRDIYIIDQGNKTYLLLKNAFYNGYINSWGTPDSKCQTKFQSIFFFKHNQYSKLFDLPVTPKVKKIKIYSYLITNLFGCPSVKRHETDEKYIIELNKKSTIHTVELQKNNIKNISIGDVWESKYSQKEHNIKIDFNGFVLIELIRRINYDQVYSYINELNTFMQLYCPNKFLINKIELYINDTFYECVCPFREINYINYHRNRSVKEGLIDFLNKAYNHISLRKNQLYINNIPRIVLYTSRDIEDNFLIYYKFIECYYKQKNIPNIKTQFISYSMTNNYKKEKLSKNQIAKYSQEIICLRNHYVHAGYHLKNNCLKISFKKVKGINDLENYTVTNIDFEWILKRTQILHDIAIDIIFSEILGYDDYDYKSEI